MADEAYHSGELYGCKAVSTKLSQRRVDTAEGAGGEHGSPKPVDTCLSDSPTSEYASGDLPSMAESEGYSSMTLLSSLSKAREGLSRSGSPCCCVVPPVAESVEVVADSELAAAPLSREEEVGGEGLSSYKRKAPDDSTGGQAAAVIRVPTIVSASAKRRHVGSPEPLNEHSSVAITLASNSDMAVRSRTAARVNFESVSELSKSDRPALRPPVAPDDNGTRSPRSQRSSASPTERLLLARAGDEDKKDSGKQSALLQVSEAHLAILPDEDGDTPLHLSVIHENLSLTKYLVKLIVGVYLNLDIANNMRQTPLHLAVITRQPQMVQLLISSGSSVNFPDRRGNTSLHLAAERRDVRILQILSKATSPLPDFNCKNFTGVTAVHVATKEASIDVLKFLFQNGANKNAQDACSGRTALHYAVEAENFTLVNFLLESGCHVNAVTFAGNTPLHIAAGRRLKELVALLMAYGANPAIANGEGDFPSDLPASLLMQRAKMNAN